MSPVRKRLNRVPTGVALSGLLLLTQLPFAPFLFLNVVNLLPERADAQVINPCPFGPSGTIVSDPGQMQQMFNANQILHQSFPDGSENLYNTTACNLPDGFRYDVYQ
ncbi:hypothetical protein HY285_02455, partial [Candidatus Peregrinibacteria bacterium]|nr:hypothetical protein [Candidatus Peregrinibacteria bacterium]